MKSFVVRNIEDDLHKLVKQRALDDGIPMNDVFKAAIKDYVKPSHQTGRKVK